MPRQTAILTCALILFALPACAPFTRTMPSFPLGPKTAASWDEKELSIIVDGFYTAQNMNEAQEAVDNAISIAPDAPVTHEIAGRLERFKGNEDEAWRHYYRALASRNNDAPYFHLMAMLDLPMTTDQYRELLALLEEILKKHPDENLRRVTAAFIASWQRRLNADTVAADRALDNRGLLEHFAVISPFGNDDGKGFAVEYPPERELNYEEEYEGTHFPARWRTDVPLNHQRNLDLGDLVSPGSWVTAYVNTYVRVPSEGNYLIRATTTDPIRLWVNDIEVLKEQKVDDDTTDQFVIPVTLRSDWNRILVKSCHETGEWQVGLGLTRSDGGLVKGLENTSKPTEIADGPAPGPGYDFVSDIERRLQNVREPSRKLYMAIALANAFGLTANAQNLSDTYRQFVPDGLFSLFASASISWQTGQGGDTIDVLDHLIEENGDKAPRLHMFRALFFESQGRSDRSREDLLAAVKANDNYRSAHFSLAANYSAEGWAEDHLKAQKKNLERWPNDTRILWGLASAYNSLGRIKKADKIHRAILDKWKGAEDILGQMITAALRRNDYSKAIRYRQKICEIYPNTPSCYYDLGILLRRAGKNDRAKEAFSRAREIDARWSAPIVKLGSMSYEDGDTESAVALWKEGLRFDPNNHSLADHVEFVAPSDAGILGDYVPTKERIRNVLAGRGTTEISPGSNIVMLLDHAVEQIERDGSSRKVVTQIFMAVNDTGRDQITSRYLEPGRLKVIETYVVDPDGTRREASSVRGHEVRFRELKSGSTVVMQYRVNNYPSGYLARYPYRRWWFHGLNQQFEDSTYVLIMPKEMKFSEWGKGDWKRDEKKRGEYKVLSYTATNVAPLVAEPGIPPIMNLLQQVIISMNPDWDNIAQWEKALLVNAFRSTPATADLAAKLTEGKKTKSEKLQAIARFVMREIRYQQDYENTIAGVKPHTASVVLQRGYGDCKDKSVLLMTLARDLNIDTRFAILRTTVFGDLIKDMPFLQFNHAIVYVPAQAGIEEPFFLDATPDTLDLATLRPDDQGTWAMTIDVATGEWEFVEIPFAPGHDQFTIRDTILEPTVGTDDAKQTTKVSIKLSFQGPTAATLRQILRNKDETAVFVSQLASQMFPASTVEDISFDGHDDIDKPLTLRITAVTGQLLRDQGESLIVDIPKSENLSKYVSLTDRRLPLQTGIFLSYAESTDEVIIPDGYKVLHRPKDLIVDNRFFHFERTSKIKSDRVVITLKFEEKVTRIEQKDYAVFRDAVTGVVDNLKQDLVLAPVKGKKKKKKKAGKPR